MTNLVLTGTNQTSIKILMLLYIYLQNAMNPSSEVKIKEENLSCSESYVYSKSLSEDEINKEHNDTMTNVNGNGPIKQDMASHTYLQSEIKIKEENLSFSENYVYSRSLSEDEINKEHNDTMTNVNVSIKQDMASHTYLHSEITIKEEKISFSQSEPYSKSSSNVNNVTIRKESVRRERLHFQINNSGVLFQCPRCTIGYKNGLRKSGLTYLMIHIDKEHKNNISHCRSFIRRMYSRYLRDTSERF